MAVLTLYQANENFNETNYSFDHRIDMSSAGWSRATDEGIVFAELQGSGITYDSSGDPVLGTITYARSINEEGDTNWTVNGIGGVAANNTTRLSDALRSGLAFGYDMTRFVLSSNDSINGSNGNDILYYSSGRDIVNGNGGIDTFNFYNNAYSYDNTSDRLVVNLEAHTYSVTTNSNVVVTSSIRNVENIVGTNEDDRITGDAQDNRLFGGGGADIIRGGSGNDYLVGGSNYSWEDDQLYGEDGNDYLLGSYGDTYFDGGNDIDTVSYHDQSRAVSINLSTGTGYHGYYSNYNNRWDYADTLVSIENAVGSSWDDTILGSSGNNVLSGGGGNDAINGGTGIDTVDYLIHGYRGVTVNLSTGAASGQGQDVLTSIENVNGSNHRDSILGNSAGNVLRGYGGNDSINGQGGNDTLYGDAGNDTLNGDAGNDRLYGGAGNDRLTGGSGRDSFVFNTALGSTNRDTITDYSTANDTIRLENAVFTRLTSTGALDSANFKQNTTGRATDSNDYIVYNTTTGALFYDRDGSGTGAAVQFATLSTRPTMSAGEFLVV